MYALIIIFVSCMTIFVLHLLVVV